MARSRLGYKLPKYAIGDVVVVKGDFEGRKYAHMRSNELRTRITEGHRDFSGRPVTILKYGFQSSSPYYFIEEDGGKRPWVDDLFSGRATNED